MYTHGLLCQCRHLMGKWVNVLHDQNLCTVMQAVYNRTNPNVALTIPAPRGMQEYHRL
jgi:hypothetical protein